MRRLGGWVLILAGVVCGLIMFLTDGTWFVGLAGFLLILTGIIITLPKSSNHADPAP